MLLIVPCKERSTHLQTLAAIAKMFKNCAIRQQLLSTESVEDVLAIFDADSSPAEAAGENGQGGVRDMSDDLKQFYAAKPTAR